MNLRISVGDQFVALELIDGWEFDSQGVADGGEPYEIYTTDRSLSREELDTLKAQVGVRLLDID